MGVISVIVPVYKVEPYIQRCIDSILAQTFTDFELILVDDGSPDCCGEICDEYTLRDSRVFVIHQKNGGLSAARNSGIKWALENGDSEWVTFIDSDDWVDTQYLSFLFKACTDCQTDISSCLYQRVNTNLSEKYEYQVNLLTPQDALVNGNNGLDARACGRLYRISLFKSARFPVGMNMEDFWLIPEILLNVERVACVNFPLYYYFINGKSITQRANYSLYLNAWAGYEKQIKLFAAKGYTDLLRLQINSYIQNVCSCIGFLRSERENNDKKMQYAFKVGRSILKRYNSYIDYQDKNTQYAVFVLDSRYRLKVKMRHFLSDNLSMNSIISLPWKICRSAYYKFIFPTVRKKYITVYDTVKRRRLKNQDFSIICTNCIGGFIYHRLKQQFLTPTINCFINPKDFVKFCENLKSYLSCELEFVETEKPYPVARLKDIYVFFNHSDNKDEAAADWYRRVKRINYDNIYIIAYDQFSRSEECLTEEEIRRFGAIECRNVAVLSEQNYPDIPYVVTIKKNDLGLGELYFDQDKYGVRTFERHFDYVSFLNKR